MSKSNDETYQEIIDYLIVIVDDNEILRRKGFAEKLNKLLSKVDRKLDTQYTKNIPKNLNRRFSRGFK